MTNLRHITSHRPISTDRRVSKSLTWAPTLVALIVLIYVTLCPIEMRPSAGSANLDRFLGYFIFGIIASVSFPRRANTLIFAIAATAFALEAAQQLIPGRDADFGNACLKVTAGVCGAFIGELGYAIKRFGSVVSRRFFVSNKKRRIPRSSPTVRLDVLTPSSPSPLRRKRRTRPVNNDVLEREQPQAGVQNVET